MSDFNFTSDAAKTLWDRASPKGDKHKTAFAWRESPAAVDRSVTKVIRNMTEEQVTLWLTDCLTAAEIQSRYRGEQFKAGDSIGRPKGLAVWVNAGDWASEVGSTSELKQKQNGTKCKCGEPIQMGMYCLPCYEKKVPNDYIKELREQFKNNEINLLKTPQDHVDMIKKKACMVG